MGKMLAALIAAALMILTPAAKADPGATCQDTQGACAADVPGYLQALAGGADFAAASQRAAEGTSPPSDAFASGEYRQELAKVLVRRALEEAQAR